jgi:FixJ family two-component response regulator
LHFKFASHLGEELLLSRELHFVSCLLLDLAMPGMNDLEVTQQLESRRLRIPTVFVTAHADDEVEQHLVAAGAIAILPKPVDHQRLLRLVQTVAGEQ